MASALSEGVPDLDSMEPSIKAMVIESFEKLACRQKSLTRVTSGTGTDTTAQATLPATEKPNNDHRCAKCGKQARLYCQPCAYDEEWMEAKPTWYCCKDCQKGDWDNHKSECRNTRNVNHLYRVAELAQNVFYVFREKVFDLEIDRIQVNKRTIRIWEGTYGDNVLCSFPHHLFRNSLEKEAVLAHLACTDAIAYLHSLFAKLLKGTYSEIDEVTFSPKRSHQEVSIVGKEKPPVPRCNGGQLDEEYPHALLKVKIKGLEGSPYVIDVAGAQYGYNYPTYAWGLFTLSRLQKIVSASGFGQTKKDLTTIASHPVFMIMGMDHHRDAVFENHRAIIQNMDNVLDTWMTARGISVAKMTMLSKDKHLALIGDLLEVLASGIEKLVKEASHNKALITAVKNIPATKEFPSGRTAFVRGDGSVEYVD